MIDFNTCTMVDVIERSYAMHPSLLADGLGNVGKIHRQARDTMHHGEARRIADEMSGKAWTMFKAIQDQEFVAAELDFSSTIIAFGVAAKLNCLSHNVAAAIASRS